MSSHHRLTRVLLLSTCWAILFGCVREKDLLDDQVRKLCAIDGGIKVYEQVPLPSERFNEFNEVKVPPKHLASLDTPFFYEWEVTYIKRDKPDLTRNHFKLFRQNDQKLLGEGTVYIRRGGDFPGPWQDSSLICPRNGDIKYVNLAVFKKMDAR